MIVDLHCHSCCSDGQLTPKELVASAALAGVELLALTDHDTITGLKELSLAAENTSLKIINGIELSVSFKKYVIHILGLNIQPDHEPLIALIREQNLCRIKRGEQIGMHLEVNGIKNAYEKACDIAGHERVGRPHFAQLLVQENKVADLKQAFKRFLVRGRSAYVPTAWADLETVVKAITAAKGDAVIAHPLKYRLTQSKLFELIKRFQEAGGTGIEVISGETNDAQVRDMVAICQRFNLLASSGSDFHVPGVSRINLGQQRQLPEGCTPIWHRWNVEN